MFLDIFNNVYVQAGSFFIFSLIFAKVIGIFLKKHASSLAKRTKSDIDDIILTSIAGPASIAVVLFGIYVSAKLIFQRDIIDDIFFVVFVALGTIVAARVLTVIISRILKINKRFERQPRLVNKIVTMTIFLIGIVMVLGHFDVEITPLVATLGIGGLAVGFALQSTLSNFFAGLHILSDQPVNVGDFIEVDDRFSGFVDDIGWRSTRIRTLSSTIVVIPNAKLADSIITNTSLPDKEMAALVECGVAYDSDLDKVEKIVIDVAGKMQKSVPGAVKSFEPFIRYHTFGDSNILFTIILRVERSVEKYLLKHELIKALQKRFIKEGIEISFPVRKLQSKD